MTFLWNGSDRRRRCNQRDEAVVICHCWKSKNGARATVVLCTGMGLRYGPRLRESWWIFLCYTVQRLQFVHFILWQIWGASFSPSLNSLSCSLCTAIVEGRILRALIMYLCDVSFIRRNIKPRISLPQGQGSFREYQIWTRRNTVISKKKKIVARCLSKVLACCTSLSFWLVDKILGQKLLLPMSCVKLGAKKMRLPAFCGWTNRKLITQFHATHGK